MTDREPGSRLVLLEKEIASLTDELLSLKLDHRAEIDKVKLELDSVMLFLQEVHPDYQKRLRYLREKARLEIDPEGRG